MPMPYTRPRFAVLKPGQVCGYPGSPPTDGYGSVLFPWFEAQSFYTGVRVRHRCTGTYSHPYEGTEEVYTVSYDYDVEHTWVREDFFSNSMSTPRDDKCYIHMLRGYLSFDKAPHAIRVGANTDEAEIVIGKENGVTDIWGIPDLPIPIFISMVGAGRVGTLTHWGVSACPIAIDESFPWRDLRGVHSGSYSIDVDPPDTSTIVHTYDWELL